MMGGSSISIYPVCKALLIFFRHKKLQGMRESIAGRIEGHQGVLGEVILVAHESLEGGERVRLDPKEQRALVADVVR